VPDLPSQLKLVRDLEAVAHLAVRMMRLLVVPLTKAKTSSIMVPSKVAKLVLETN
jgi:hypothetical protein